MKYVIIFGIEIFFIVWAVVKQNKLKREKEEEENRWK